MSNVQSKTPVSPTPTIVFDKLGKFLDDYKQAKASSSTQGRGETMVSSGSQIRLATSSQNPVFPTLATESADDRSKIDLSVLNEYIPADDSVQTEILTKIIEYYASSGRIDAIKGFDSEHKALLSDWRHPTLGLRDEQAIYRTYLNSLLNWNTAWYTDSFSGSNQSNGTCIPLTTIATANDPQIWNRQSSLVKMIECEYKMVIYQALAQSTGSDPNVSIQERPFMLDIYCIVDSFALLSNKTGGSGVAVPLAETAIGTNAAGTDPNSIFFCGSGVTLASNPFQTSIMYKNNASAGRFHILYHHTINLSDNDVGWFTSNVGLPTNAFQMPGAARHVEGKFPLDIICPYRDVSAVEPYMNSCYLMIIPNRASADQYTVIAQTQVKTVFKDVGQSY